MSSSRILRARLDVWCAVACLTMSIGIADVRAQAQGAAAHWQGWTIAPYAWISDTKGRVGGGGAASDVNLTAKDLLKSVNVAIMAIGELRRDPWLGRVDFFYASISDDEDLSSVVGAPATIHVDEGQTMISPEVGYTVYKWPKGLVDVLAGIRYWHMANDLGLTLPTGSGSQSTNTSWVDGIAGADVAATPWGPRWHLFALGDLGGGGSNFTWQAFGGGTYDFNDWGSVSAAYRYLHVAYESEKLIDDVAMSGPAISVGFRF